jgi:glyoxylase-like metal-dependent hydrolase (beta-lactamase superfamily II)
LKQYIDEVIHKGDASGNDMTVRFRLLSGLEIYGLPTKNFYGGHWDLGPTWNYAVMADRPFLVDAGRVGQGENLIAMMESVGITPRDLDFVLISHSHEDHDGGLAELVEPTRIKVKAHAIYDLLIRKFPDQAPPGYKQQFPAKCWHCVMPESFYQKNCLHYHRVLQDLKIEKIGDGNQKITDHIASYHLAGHSPDCLAVLLGDEALIVGDIILPGITPWPTREAMFDEVAEVIKPEYTEPRAVFGLTRYIKSLKKLGQIADRFPDILVLPAHRFYYNDQWNGIRLGERVNELIDHHTQRCGAIIDILRNGSGPQTAEDIAHLHFEERLLEGFGSFMAANEMISHCELLTNCGDVVSVNSDAYSATGSEKFETYIEALRPDY